jgi:hypothetical protein
MSQTKATPAKPLVPVQSEEDEENGGESSVPTLTDQGEGVHNRSHAAHLKEGQSKPHTKPEGNLRQGSHPGGRRQP